ncbi:MAG: isoprenylcysteine carboxylmethyltransferase family protein [Nitrospirae bacterium]|nr:MAG: isoprenylcysteine carboxylmethyltransferase family protein [Nitrospirota bacterium]
MTDPRTTIEPLRHSPNPRPSFVSYVLVSAQFACLIAILATGPIIAHQWMTVLLEGLGISLGGWAVWTCSIRNLQVFPEVKPGARLITDGPYRWIRHPMYSALLLVTLALILDEWSWWRAGWWLALAMILLVKLAYEEQALRETFPEYAAYQRRTFRLIPFIY